VDRIRSDGRESCHRCCYGTVLRSIDGGATWPQTGAELRLADAFSGVRCRNPAACVPLMAARSATTATPLTTSTAAFTPAGRKFSVSDDGTIHFAMNAGSPVFSAGGTISRSISTRCVTTSVVPCQCAGGRSRQFLAGLRGQQLATAGAQ
jgi:hypothetical protein